MLARRALSGFGAAGVALVGLGVALGGCPSSNPAGPALSADATTDVNPDAGPAICSYAQFFDAGGAGGPCPMPSPVVCFPVCTAGGCSCVLGPAGTPVWQCTTDTSCLPECGPLEDSCAGGGDANVDARVDAGADVRADVSDAGVDAEEAGVGAADAAEGGAEASADAAVD